MILLEIRGGNRAANVHICPYMLSPCAGKESSVCLCISACLDKMLGRQKGLAAEKNNITIQSISFLNKIHVERQSEEEANASPDRLD